MAPPLTDEQLRFINNLYYKEHNITGRDRLFFLTQKLGSDISRRQIMDFLARQEIHQKFQRPLRFTGVRAIVSTKHGSFQADTLAMESESYRGFTAIYSMIDTFSRKIYAKAIRTKSAQECTRALREILAQNPNMKFTRIMTDNGTEFQNVFADYIRERGIQHDVSRPGQPFSNGLIERSNFQVRKVCITYMETSGKTDWPNKLDELVDSLNSTFNSTTKKSPNDLENAGEDSEEHKSAANNIVNRAGRSLQTRGATLLKINDKVRKVLQYSGSNIRKASRVGYFDINHLYTVARVVESPYPNQLPSYKLKDSNDNLLKGLFSRAQLLFVPATEDAAINFDRGVANEINYAQFNNEEDEAEPEEEEQPLRRSGRINQDEEYEVEYIIDKRRRRSGRRTFVEYLVKYKDYPIEQSTWERVGNINAPDLIRDFEKRHR